MRNCGGIGSGRFGGGNVAGGTTESCIKALPSVLYLFVGPYRVVRVLNPGLLQGGTRGVFQLTNTGIYLQEAMQDSRCLFLMS